MITILVAKLWEFAFGEAVIDPNILPPSTGAVKTKAQPLHKVIYGKDLTFKGGSNTTTLQIIPKKKPRKWPRTCLSSWEDPKRVFSLVGDGYLLSKLKAIRRYLVIPDLVVHSY